MQNTYAQKNDTVQIASANTAESVRDNSAQAQSLQRKADLMNASVQRAPEPRPNLTGMPDNLKSGIESLSGFSMDDVRVHYNSSKPATVQALAYTQGTDIHVAPGQEHTLPHEAWHVAQQMAGRVSPTTNINGMPVNDNAGLEHEADVMGEKAVQCKMPKNGETIQCKGIVGKIIQQHKGKKRKKESNPAPNPALSNTGANPYALDQRYNHSATFHHIYPKSKLVKYVLAIENAYLNSKMNFDRKGTRDEFEYLRNEVTGNGVNANSFYWSRGTGFIGYPPDKRSDDPHNSAEDKCPKSMDADVFTTAKKSRISELENLYKEIEHNNITLNTVSNCRNNERVLRDKAIHYTEPYSLRDKKNISIDWTTAWNDEFSSLLGDESEPSKDFKLK